MSVARHSPAPVQQWAITAASIPWPIARGANHPQQIAKPYGAIRTGANTEASSGGVHITHTSSLLLITSSLHTTQQRNTFRQCLQCLWHKPEGMTGLQVKRVEHIGPQASTAPTAPLAACCDNRAASPCAAAAAQLLLTALKAL